MSWGMFALMIGAFLLGGLVVAGVFWWFVGKALQELIGVWLR